MSSVWLWSLLGCGMGEAPPPAASALPEGAQPATTTLGDAPATPGHAAPIHTAPDEAPAPEESAADPAQAAAARAEAVRQELALLGQPAPPLPSRWMQQGAGNPGPERVRLLVFVDASDPAAPTVLQQVEARSAPHRARGLHVLAVVRHASAQPAFAQTLRAAKVTLPALTDPDGAFTRAWRRSAAVSAALVHEGRVVWTGSPSGLRETTVERYL